MISQCVHHISWCKSAVRKKCIGIHSSTSFHSLPTSDRSLNIMNEFEFFLTLLTLNFSVDGIHRDYISMLHSNVFVEPREVGHPSYLSYHWK